MQSTLRAFLVFLVLGFIGASAPTPSFARQELLPTDVTTAAGNVQTVIDRANAMTARIKAHRFAPTYYQDPCQPTKLDGDASLAQFRRDLRALRAQSEALEAEIRDLEVNSANKLNLGQHGWDFQDLKRFRPLQGAVQAAFSALAAREAELDAMVAKPCPKPEAPKKPITDGPNTTPLTPQEEGEFSEDFPLPIPVFDDPVVLPKPPVFCTYEQRKAWMDTVFWPTAERAKQNRLKAIDTFLKAEKRLRDVQDADRESSPRIALAARAVEYWKAEKERRRLIQEGILATDVPNPIECEKPKTTTGGTPPTTPTPQPTTPPITDGPVTPPPPAKPKLPAPALSRPQFERVPDLTVPTRFCNEFERNDYLTKVYNPAVASALHNATLAQEHQARLNALFTQYMQANSEYWSAVRAERDAWEPIAAAATSKAEALRQLYGAIMGVPVIPCGATTPPQPPPPPPPPPPHDGPVKPGSVSFTPDFPEITLPPSPGPCSKAALREYLETLRILRGRIGEALDELDALGITSTYAGRRGDSTLSEETGKALTAIRNRYEDQRAEIDLARKETARLLDAPTPADCPPEQGFFTPPPEDPPYDDPKPEPQKPREPEVPCPPKEGREPISVGPNSKVGSGAQLRAKVGGMAMGALMGALGGGGGGGGSDGPDLWTCKIKDSEYTVFDDPATGVSLKVGARRAKGGKVVIFSEIAKSPDKGTFQTAFLENPTTGETQGPTDVGPCDLWGEWKLTVSWTKTTYVNGQMVDRQSGGWSKSGLFSVPGALSKVDAPDGLWKRMGFSSASNGAREIGMIYDVPPGGGPLTFVIHVTRPKGDPVTTVPFVLTLTEGPKGFVFTKTEDPPCPDVDTPRTVEVGDTTSGPPISPSQPPAPPKPPAPKPAPPPPPSIPVSSLPDFTKDQETDDQIRSEILSDTCDDGEAWEKKRTVHLTWMQNRLAELRRSVAIGPKKAAIEAKLAAEILRLEDDIEETRALKPPPSKPACPPAPPSVLDDLGKIFVPASDTGTPLSPPLRPVVSEPDFTEDHVDDQQALDSLDRMGCDVVEHWKMMRLTYLKWLILRLNLIRGSIGIGPGAAVINRRFAEEIARLQRQISIDEKLEPPKRQETCPPEGERKPDSVLPDLERILVPA